jgi:hypothetical protein
MKYHDLAVSKYNLHRTREIERIYEGINSLEEAFLLAQLAMKNKENDELIVIMPGWNQDMNEDEIKKASELAEKYAVDNQ